MDQNELYKIYDEMDSLRVDIEPKIVPDPSYITQKIGQCHVCIEATERIYIRVNKEHSTLQRALNNAQAKYEYELDELISKDPEIISLPSLRDREAKANTKLRTTINEIKAYENDLSDLDPLLTFINVKLRNLSRLNNDIKLQLRLMESQIKLGSPTNVNEAAAKSLFDELRKGHTNQDMLAVSETVAEETKIIDPTSTLDINSLLTTNKDGLMSGKLCGECEPYINRGVAGITGLVCNIGINNLPIQESTPQNNDSDSEQNNKQNDEDELESSLDISGSDNDPEDDIFSNAETEAEELKEEPEQKTTLDLNKLTEITQQPGGELKLTQVQLEPPKETPKVAQSLGAIDIDSLLGQWK